MKQLGYLVLPLALLGACQQSTKTETTTTAQTENVREVKPTPLRSL